MNAQLSARVLVAAILLVCCSLAQGALPCEPQPPLTRVLDKTIDSVISVSKREAIPSCWNAETTELLKIVPVRNNPLNDLVLHYCIDKEGLLVKGGTVPDLVVKALSSSPTCASVLKEAKSYIEKNALPDFKDAVLTRLNACNFCQ